MSAYLRGPLPAIAGAAGVALSAFFVSAVPAQAQDACPSLFQAAPGETLAAISEKCRIPLGDLFRANPAIRHAGMPLDGLPIHIPENHDHSALNWNAIGGGSGTPTDADFWTPERGDQIVRAGSEGNYRVHEGDTLGDIAARLNVSINEMLAANPDIADPDALYAGEIINVPGSATLVDFDQGRRFYHRYHLAPRITALPTDNGNLRILAVGLPPNTEVNLSAVRESDHNAFAKIRTSSHGSLKLDVPLPPEFAHAGDHVVIASVDGEVRASSKPIGTAGPETGAVWPGARPSGYYPASYSESAPGYQDYDYAGARVGEQMTINGVVTPEGDHCPAVRDASGKLYSLATTNETLHPGDVVSVDGRVAPGDWCSKGIALAVSSLHFQPNWTSARAEVAPPVTEVPRYRRESDVAPSPALPPIFDSTPSFGDAPSARPRIIRGTLTDEASDCTTIRGDDGTLYSIPARLTSIYLGQQLEIKGYLARHPACSVGLTFRLEDARKL